MIGVDTPNIFLAKMFGMSSLSVQSELFCLTRDLRGFLAFGDGFGVAPQLEPASMGTVDGGPSRSRDNDKGRGIGLVR